ncbi:hypothetical protein [Streptomyces sp. CRN 30]|uniref:hypothetical protein n=1 Tax=Streptomyces sp. CRN 30 TaxID=3075613 RepID=UPI002A841A45|nr:hypothetical protein [Streptomyces sp. CRN 30]
MSTRDFEELVAEGAAVPTDGWDFSWFEGRATEARPSWGYARAMAGRLARARAALDIQTGGGEHVGPASVFELVEFFLGPQPEESRNARRPDRERADAEAAGLDVVGLRAERLRMEFFDIGAVVHFLRKVVWMVPDFTVDAYLPRLRELHERIERDGPFVAHSTRHLFEARRPAR